MAELWRIVCGSESTLFHCVSWHGKRHFLSLQTCAVCDFSFLQSNWFFSPGLWRVLLSLFVGVATFAMQGARRAADLDLDSFSRNISLVQQQELTFAMSHSFLSLSPFHFSPCRTQVPGWPEGAVRRNPASDFGPDTGAGYCDNSLCLPHPP